jgi:hypothetical protein
MMQILGCYNTLTKWECSSVESPLISQLQFLSNKLSFSLGVPAERTGVCPKLLQLQVQYGPLMRSHSHMAQGAGDAANCRRAWCRRTANRRVAERNNRGKHLGRQLGGGGVEESAREPMPLCRC